LGFTEYSNLNFVLLGLVIERVSGVAYAEYIQQNVFAPLGMEHAHFSFAEANADGMAHTFRIMFGVPVPYDDDFVPAQQSAGYVYASAEDMARFLVPYLNEGYNHDVRVVEPQYRAGVVQQDGWFDIYWQWKYGPPNGVQPMHEGGTSSANAAIIIDPGSKPGVGVLTNTRVGVMFPDVSGAAVIAQGVMQIAQGSTPDMFSDGGFHANYMKYNLSLGAFLLVVLFELASGLWLWRRWWLRGKRWAQVVFFVLLGLDVLAALAILLGAPILTEISWPKIIQMHADLLIVEFVAAWLLFAAACAKGYSVFFRKKNLKPEVPLSANGVH